MGARVVGGGLAALLLGGCTYGVRGGPTVLAYGSGPVLAQAAVTGSAGFGATSREGRNDGVAETVTLAVGGDARGGGTAVSLLGGFEWFSVGDAPRSRWGYRVGIDVGGCWRSRGASGGELAMQLRGGPLLRIVDREGTEHLLLTLGVEALVGMASDLADPPGGQTSVTAGVAVSIGATRIGRFHF